MDSSQRDDSLSRTLQAWRVAPVRNPQFRAEVRQQIEPGKAGSWLAYARLHAAIVTGALALAVLIGALAGREQARTRVALERTKMASAYVQALDARSMQMP